MSSTGICFSSDESDNEIDDKEVSKLLVVTQNPRARDATKRTLDRTGDYETRAKMSAELAKAINEGLIYYEKVNFSNMCIHLRHLRFIGLLYQLGY